MTDDDVPAGVDFKDPAQTAEWIATSEAKRPERAELRRVIVDRVVEAARVRVLDAAKVEILDATKLHVLELGAGPGYLAETILAACDVERYVALDFAQPMLDAAHQRLGDRVTYHREDFLDPAWPSRLRGPFDAIVTMQAVHELRHKRRARRLYEQARVLARPGSVLVVCDHAPKDDPRTRALHATAAEQLAAMTAAGFADATVLAEINAMYVVASVAT